MCRQVARLAQLGIKYIHIPQLGIESARRKNVSSDEDLTKLFANSHKQELQELKALHNQHHKIALTCLERDAVPPHLRKRLPHGIEVLHLPED